MLSNLMIKFFLKSVIIMSICLAAAFHVFADISLVENVLPELSLPQTKIADVTFNNVLSIQSQVNFSSNSVILQKIGEFAYCYKISLITSSLLISTLTLTTIAISNMFSDPIILTLPELTQELVLLPKIPIPITQPGLFSVQATFFNANSLIDPNNVITPYLADLLARDPRIGVNLTDLNTMPQVLQLFSVIN